MKHNDMERSADIVSWVEGEGEDPNFDRKLDLITAGADSFLKEHLLARISQENCLTIINYILAIPRVVHFSLL